MLIKRLSFLVLLILTFLAVIGSISAEDVTAEYLATYKSVGAKLQLDELMAIKKYRQMEATRQIPVVSLSDAGLAPFQSETKTPEFRIPGKLDLVEALIQSKKAAENEWNATTRKELRKCKIMLVSGYLSDIGGKGPILAELTPSSESFFYTQVLWFIKRGVDYERVPVHTQSSIFVNAAIIIKAIEASNKPVILIGHSKGGLDIVEALITDPDLKNKVRGVILNPESALRHPYCGYLC